MTSNLFFLNSCKTEFLLIGLTQQLSRIHNSSTLINTTTSARNLGFIFDEHLSFSDQISALSKFCYHHIRALHCIRSYLDLHTAKTIATSVVHSKLDYYNSLWSSEMSNKSYPTHPECSCSNCCPRSKIPTHHSEDIEYKKSSLSLTKFSIPLSHSISQPPHGHNTRSTPYVSLIITCSASDLWFISFFKPY